MVRYHARVLWALTLLVFGLSAAHAWAGPPTDQFRDGVERVFKVLRDPELKGEAKADRRRIAIAKISEEIFDFSETAKRSLGQHWDTRTPAERQEFIRLFTELVQGSYVSRSNGLL